MRLIQDGDEKLERKLKKQFKDYHIRGEWFWPSNELMRYIGRYAGPYKEGQRIRVTRKHSRKRRREGIISKVIFHCERNGMPKGLDFPQYEIELDDGDSVKLHAPDITCVKKSDYV